MNIVRALLEASAPSELARNLAYANAEYADLSDADEYIFKNCQDYKGWYCFKVPYDNSEEGDETPYQNIRNIDGVHYCEYEDSCDMLVFSKEYVDLADPLGIEAEKARQAEEERMRTTPYDPFDL